jgi:hypothetical protein
VWRRCFSHACAFSRGIKSENFPIPPSQQPDKSKRRKHPRTDFVEHEDEPLTLRFAPAYLFLYQSAATPRRISRVKYEKDDVCPSTTLCSVRMQCLRICSFVLPAVDVDSDGADKMFLAEVDAAN